MEQKELTYTKASERLEAIVEQIESQNPSIDELTSLVEEAIRLSKYCRKRLEETDKQLSQMISKLDEEEG